MICTPKVRHFWRCISETGGISVSGIALIILAAHKFVFYWPASHAIVTYYP